MGWFCTTSFGGDAFQMGSVESFFTLLLSSLHLALSLTALWSLSFSLPLNRGSHTLLLKHTDNYRHNYRMDANVCMLLLEAHFHVCMLCTTCTFAKATTCLVGETYSSAI